MKGKLNLKSVFAVIVGLLFFYSFEILCIQYGRHILIAVLVHIHGLN